MGEMDPFLPKRAPPSLQDSRPYPASQAGLAYANSCRLGPPSLLPESPMHSVRVLWTRLGSTCAT